MLQVLVLEDDVRDLELMQQMLNSEELRCQFVNVVTQADFVQALQTQTFELILADYALPGFDGLAALTIAKQTHPFVPFILVSGVLGEEQAIEALQKGATDYVLKQRLDRLLPATRRALRETENRAERLRAEQALRESEERFRTSVETMVDCFGIYLTQRNPNRQVTDFQIEYVNQAACQYLKTHLEQLINQPLKQAMPFVHETPLFADLCQVLETGQALNQEYLLSSVEEATPVAIDVRAAKLRDGLVVTWRDVSERKQTEAEREQLIYREQSARAEAEAANRLKDEFIATLSHELRTPLNAIQGWVQLLSMRRLDDNTFERGLETIQRNTRSLSQLVEDILDVSRIVRDQMQLNLTLLKTADLVAVIRATVETVQPQASEKKIQLKTDFAPFEGAILGDSDRLQQVLLNLLSNAIKFTPEDGQVQISLHPGGDRVQIRVTDTGQGIAPDVLPHIFERFRQADSSTTRSQRGLGLGLAIVHYITEAHDGHVSAASAGLGKGATFTVEIPTIQIEGQLEPTPEIRSSLLAKPPKPYELNHLKILVVEDVADTRKLYKAILQQYGANVQTVANAEEGLKAFTANPPQVLISDISMPGEDGYSLIGKVRELEAHNDHKTPAIALTAHSRAVDQSQILAAGFQAHLAKPIDVQQLIRLIQSLVQPRSLEGV
ncbi:response regulator [Almyronema epifaneia]|uniref:histidine kinase n=1 Tax=Almyronema epifaneia S1 TaxID=2991925 RepID=A0ABW6IER4_9CYAN